MGRLDVDGKPLTRAYFNAFDVVLPEPPELAITDKLSMEPLRGKRIQRIFLDTVSHLPKLAFDPLMRAYWREEVKIMNENRVAKRNEFMDFGVKSFFQLHQSDLYTQWLQEYFISEENLPQFLSFLSDTLEKNEVRVLNASIRPVPDESSDLETTHYLIDDPNNALEEVVVRWNEQRMETEFNGKHPFERCDIQVIYDVEGRKLIKVPYYKPFTEITKLLAETDIRLIKTGGQDKITVDLCLSKDEENPSMEGAEVIYGMNRLQDSEERRFVTYEVSVDRLVDFCRHASVKNHIEYMHVHR